MLRCRFSVIRWSRLILVIFATRIHCWLSGGRGPQAGQGRHFPAIRVSQNERFPALPYNMHERGQYLYHSKNLPSFSYPSDGIQVQFKLSLSLSTSTIVFLWIQFQKKYHSRGTTEAPTDYRGLADQSQAQKMGGRAICKCSKHLCVSGTYRSASSCAGGSGRGHEGGKENMTWEGSWRTWVKLGPNLTVTTVGKASEVHRTVYFSKENDWL